MALVENTSVNFGKAQIYGMCIRCEHVPAFRNIKPLECPGVEREGATAFGDLN